MERTNKPYIVGTLKEVNLRKGSKDGKDYIGGDFVVEVTPTNLIEMKVFSFAKTNDGKENKRYSNYETLESLKGRRVKVTGEFSGRAFYQASQGQVIPFNEITASFINLAKDTDENTATFEFSGYVYKPLTERLDKEEKVIGYDLEVAQANYNGDNIQVIRFSVDPEARGIVNSVRNNYTKHSTISFSGIILHTPVTQTKTEEVEFGDPIVKTFTSVRKSYLITGGKAVIMNDLAYTPAQISALESAYANYIASVEKDAKEQASAGKQTISTPQQAKTSNVNSLI